MRNLLGFYAALALVASSLWAFSQLPTAEAQPVSSYVEFNTHNFAATGGSDLISGGITPPASHPTTKYLVQLVLNNTASKLSMTVTDGVQSHTGTLNNDVALEPNRWYAFTIDAHRGPSGSEYEYNLNLQTSTTLAHMTVTRVEGGDR